MLLIGDVLRFTKSLFKICVNLGVIRSSYLAHSLQIVVDLASLANVFEKAFSFSFNFVYATL